MSETFTRLWLAQCRVVHRIHGFYLTGVSRMPKVCRERPLTYSHMLHDARACLQQCQAFD